MPTLQQAPDIVRVTWRQVPYTQAKLTSEMRRIMSRFRGRLTSGVARQDGTGIKFTTTDAELLEASEPQVVLECRYPVTIEYGEPPSRNDPPAKRSARIAGWSVTMRLRTVLEWSLRYM